MSTIEDLLDALNDSDVANNMRDLGASVSTLESVDAPADFLAELETAMELAEELLKTLRTLKTEVAQ